MLVSFAFKGCNNHTCAQRNLFNRFLMNFPPKSHKKHFFIFDVSLIMEYFDCVKKLPTCHSWSDTHQFFTFK